MKILAALAMIAVSAAAAPIGPIEPAAPLEYSKVIQLFTRMTGVKPTPLHPLCAVFSLGELFRRSDHVESVIVVTEDAPNFAVSFLISGNHGMNFVSEFFEAPFFTRAESEEFYRILYGPPGTTTEKFTHFTLTFSRLDTPEWRFIAMSFAPPAPPVLPPPLP